MYTKDQQPLEPKRFLPSNPEKKGEGGLRTKGLFKQSCQDKPLISVVTVVYNGEEHLEQTILSVLEQDYDNVDYIIVDGGSTDSTLDIIKKYEDAIDYWVSEPDKGIYNAMNKGVALCTGNYIGFINAGDFYNNNNIINDIVNIVNKENSDYIFGNIYAFSSGNISKVIKPTMDKYKVDMPFGHPSLFVRRSIMLKFGFSEKYKIVSDYDFVLKLVKKQYSYSYIDKIITQFRLDGISSTNSYEKEFFILMKEHFGSIYALYRFQKRFRTRLVKKYFYLFRV